MTPVAQRPLLDATVTYHVGDSRQVLGTLPESSVDLILTSCPYLALRSYLPPGHPEKALEMGSERTPGEWLDALLDVVEGCRRVLAPHGSLVMECGDSLAGSGGAGGDYSTDGLRAGQERFNGSSKVSRRYDRAVGIDGPGQHWRGTRPGWPLDKSHCMAPEILRFAMAYGFNPLTRRETPQWRVRNVVRHCRPNPPVGALADSWRRATSDYLVACTGSKRYFDLEAVRHTKSTNTHTRTARGVDARLSTGKTANDRRGGNFSTLATLHSTEGAPPLDWFDADDLDRFPCDAWVVPNVGSSLDHYAMFNPAVLVPFIKCMSPQRVCTGCGRPSVRLTEATRTLDGVAADLPAIGDNERAGATANGVGHRRLGTTTKTTGWSECSCDAPWRPGVVLDPFVGSGTTLAVAHGHGRSSIGIDLDERDLELARQRMGMFLEDGDDVRTDEALQPIAQGSSTEGTLP